jgi:hypothetical protein
MPGMTMGSPLQGTSTKAIRLAAHQTGRSVKGSVAVSAAGTGGHLSVTLLASRHVLAPSVKSAALVPVGKTTESLKQAGTARFTVVLTKAGAAALKRLHRLPVTVRIAVTPARGTTLTVTRRITLAS